MEIIDKVINENGINDINNSEFIDNFNNIKNIKIINAENMRKKSLYYLDICQ